MIRPTCTRINMTKLSNGLMNNLNHLWCFYVLEAWGSFGATQVKEISLGLEQSGQRFLWSLRLPPVPQGKTTRASNSSNTEDILPDGFLGRVLQRKGIYMWVSSTGAGLGPQGNWWFCVSLWVELNSGEHVAWCAYSDMDNFCRRTAQCI